MGKESLAVCGVEEGSQIGRFETIRVTRETSDSTTHNSMSIDSIEQERDGSETGSHMGQSYSDHGHLGLTHFRHQ